MIYPCASEKPTHNKSYLLDLIGLDTPLRLQANRNSPYSDLQFGFINSLVPLAFQALVLPVSYAFFDASKLISIPPALISTHLQTSLVFRRCHPQHPKILWLWYFCWPSWTSKTSSPLSTIILLDFQHIILYKLFLQIMPQVQSTTLSDQTGAPLGSLWPPLCALSCFSWGQIGDRQLNMFWGIGTSS